MNTQSEYQVTWARLEAIGKRRAKKQLGDPDVVSKPLPYVGASKIIRFSYADSPDHFCLVMDGVGRVTCRQNE